MIVSRVLVATLLSAFATALPHRVRDSAINEPAVSAPNGTPITEGAEPMATAADNGSSDPSTSSSVESSAASEVTSQATSTTVSEVISQATSTTVAWDSYQTPTYGSGSSNWGSWGGSNYNDCVSQCLAQYGNSPQPWTPPTQTTPDSGSGGTGVTHTVIVAPSQGVLRYVPFAVNASVGDTVMFMWGANNHTVTKSSSLAPCNKTDDTPFASGIQVKDFVFTQVVNDTNPTFFHCAVPSHCQKGMFGIINPPSSAGAGTSVSLMMSNWTSSNPDLAAYSAITSNVTQNNAFASNWGGNIDVGSLPEWSHPMVAENVMYTRNFLATNPETTKDGSIDLSSAANTPLMFPQDISAALNNAGAAPNDTSISAPIASADPTSATSSASASASASGTASNLNNGAAATSPKFVVALVAAAASFFLL